jgi:glycosidase
MSFWLDRGVDGFRVDAMYPLFEDKELRHEKRSFDPKARPGDYSLWNATSQPISPRPMT